MTAVDGPIGFVGIGIMGSAMAERLLAQGRDLVVWNREPENLETVVGLGAIAADSPAAVAAACDLVMVCVLDTAAVDAVVFGPDGVAQAATPEKILIDHSTADPVATKEMAQRLLAAKGMRWVDAPVSGGPGFAKDGKLTIMAGGDDAAVEQITPVMAQLAGNFTRVGEVGAGQTAKVINQAICGVGYVLMAEALALVEAAGIDPSSVPACLKGGHADSTMLHYAFPKMAARDFDPPASLSRQMAKDLRAVLAFTESLGVDLPLVSLASQRYQDYQDAGGGMQETASIYRLYSDKQRTGR